MVEESISFFEECVENIIGVGDLNFQLMINLTIPL